MSFPIRKAGIAGLGWMGWLKRRRLNLKELKRAYPYGANAWYDTIVTSISQAGCQFPRGRGKWRAEMSKRGNGAGVKDGGVKKVAG